MCFKTGGIILLSCIRKVKKVQQSERLKYPVNSKAGVREYNLDKKTNLN